jgi:hypothetical protein
MMMRNKGIGNRNMRDVLSGRGAWGGEGHAQRSGVKGLPLWKVPSKVFRSLGFLVTFSLPRSLERSFIDNQEVTEGR